MEKKKHGGDKPKRHGDYSKFYKKPKSGPKKKASPAKSKPDKVKDGGYRRKDEGLIRLNKYLADAGVCSRREADKLIASGAVKVNGKVVKNSVQLEEIDTIEIGSYKFQFYHKDIKIN